MAELKKFVECTPEQYITLLKEGQIEINGEIKTKEENTYYMPGELVLLEWYNKIMDAQYRKYKVNHSPMNIKSLEQEYNELIEKDSALASVSAIGYNAILENGDKIVVNEPNKGDFYIDGELVTNDYTFTGEGYEVVNVWVFESNSDDLSFPPSITDTHNFTIKELDVRNIAKTPVVGDSYKNYAQNIKAYNFLVEGVANRKLVSNGVETFNQKKLSSTIEEVESDCTTLDNTVGGMNGQVRLKKAIFPNLETIKGTPIANCTNNALVFYYPKLKTIIGGESSNVATFLYVPNVVLPPSVQIIRSGLFRHNQTITLNCNKAQSISSNWCFSAPTVNFIMCSDWQASINIAVAAKNHTKDWFIDLFQNKLHDFSGEGITREITIPLAIFNDLTAEERAIVENKNWILGGA